MKITAITFWQVPLTSHATYYTDDGQTRDTIASTVMGFDTDTAPSGWREVRPIPHCPRAYAEGVRPELEFLAPAVIGTGPFGIEAVMRESDPWESDITPAQSLHLAAATPTSRVLNTFDLSGYVACRLDPKVPVRRSGRIGSPEGAGQGVAPDPDLPGQSLTVIN